MVDVCNGIRSGSSDAGDKDDAVALRRVVLKDWRSPGWLGLIFWMLLVLKELFLGPAPPDVVLYRKSKI